MKTKRISAGVYEYTFENDLMFHVVKVEGLSSWYFINAKNNSEGGNDHFRSKAEALAALLEYIPLRTYDPVYGWVMRTE